MKKKAEGVWIADPGIVCWTQGDIKFVEREAPLTEKKRARILAHQEIEGLQEMLIAFSAESRNPMHSHEWPESMLVLKGTMQVDFEDRIVILGPHDFLRIPAGVRHCPIPLTDCVILETTVK